MTRAWGLLALFIVCAGACRGARDTRCALGEAALVARQGVASYDGIALMTTGARAHAVWSHKLGLFAQPLAGGHAPVRLDEPCSGGIAAVARGATFIACARRPAGDQAGSLWLLALDDALRVRERRALAALGRDARGVSLAASKDTLYVAYGDGEVGGPRVLLLALPLASAFSAPPRTRALSRPEQNARDASLIVHEGAPVVAFTTSELDADGPRHRLMIARGDAPARALREVQSKSPLPALASDRDGLVLAFRDLPRPGARLDLYLARVSAELRLQGPPRTIGRANGHGAPSLALCASARAVAVPIDHGGELYVAFHPLSSALEAGEANHQYYESEREFVEAQAGCLQGQPLALIAERTEANEPGARLLAAEFRCTQ